MNKLIKTAKEHTAAIRRVSALMDTNPPPGSDESDEIELLAHLIEVYEMAKHPIDLPGAVQAIQFRSNRDSPARISCRFSEV